MDDNLVDIMLGSNWLKTLGMFIINEKWKFMALFYGKNKITVHDLSVGVPQSQNTDEGSTYGNYEDLEEEVKCSNKIIIIKDEEIV